MSKLDAINKQLTALSTKRTKLNEDLNAVVAKIKELELERDTAAANSKYHQQISDGLPVGTVVAFTYGRAEKKRELEGNVVATRKTDTCTQYRISVGSGFEVELLNVTDAQITGFVGAEPSSLDLSSPTGNAVDPAAAAAANA